MPRTLFSLRTLFITTSCGLLAMQAQAFDPNAGAMDVAAAPTAPTMLAQADTTPLYAPGTVAPSMPSYASPLAPITMPQRPLYPASATAAPVTPPAAATAPVSTGSIPTTPVAIPAPAATPVAIPNTVSQPLAAPASGFVAPAPVIALPATTAVTQPAMAPTPATQPAIAAAPVASPVASAPQPELSDSTRSILSHIPAGIDTPPKTSKGVIAIKRVSPDVKALTPPPAEEKYESSGISISVSRPGLDTNFELNRAYTALMGGDTQTAISTYQNILSVEPNNTDALFGLAATYHRLGDTDHARPLYGKLLELDPNNREGLNNFLVLVAEESPADALPELQRLEARNPDFSPIAAQTALVLDKLGYADQAEQEMLHAIDLAPDNLTYQYNLAVMLDQHGRMDDAAAIYEKLVHLSSQGAKLPASTEAIEKRLNYLVTRLTSEKTVQMGAH